jgi:hypothetical protein
VEKDHLCLEFLGQVEERLPLQNALFVKYLVIYFGRLYTNKKTKAVDLIFVGERLLKPRRLDLPYLPNQRIRFPRSPDFETRRKRHITKFISAFRISFIQAQLGGEEVVT